MNRNNFMIVYTQYLPPFSNRLVPLHIFTMLPVDDILAVVLTHQQTDSINHLSYIHAFQLLAHTPPQVDKFVCKNVKIKVVGKRSKRKTHHDQKHLSDYGILTLQDWLKYEEDQSKSGDQKPDKTKPDKVKTDKSKRENDKGQKKVRPPKKGELTRNGAYLR